MSRAFMTMLPGIAVLLACAGGASAYDTLFLGSSTTNEVYRYQVQPSGTPLLDLTLTANLDRPSFLELNGSASELFVVNRGNAAGGSGSVARFLDPNGAATPNGVIADQNGVAGFDFSLPHDVAFRGNEMFVVNSFSDNVLRFIFDGAGAALSNGIISLSPAGQNLRGVVVGPSGNLFLTVANTSSAQVHEFGFDGFGNASPGPVFSTPGFNDHGMAFAPWGELFVAEAGSNSIARFLIDVGGNPTFNGQITGNGMSSPIDLTFSNWGELFVANSLGALICRWTFTSTHGAEANGSFAIPHPTSGIRFGTHTITGVGAEVPPNTRSFPPYPNPTPRDTRIDFSLAGRTRVSAEVFDSGGRTVRELLSAADLAAGPHAVFWDGSDARGDQAHPGLYFVRFRAGQRSWSERVVVVR